MTISTKNEILDHLLSKKVEPDLRNIEEFSAHILSSELHISRSLASQYLNGFVKEGLLIKIATRPVASGEPAGRCCFDDCFPSGAMRTRRC